MSKNLILRKGLFNGWTEVQLNNQLDSVHIMFY